MIAENDINNAYDKLSKARQAYGAAEVLEIENKTQLESMYASDIVNGVITGKNDAERKGQFEADHPEMIASIRSYIQNAMWKKLDLDLANIEVSRVRALLRLAEVTAKLESEEE